MLELVARRLAQGLVVVIAATMLAFAMFSFLGDPVNAMVNSEVTLDQRAALRKQLGLDRPLHIRYAAFVGDIMSGRFGISYQNQESVTRLIAGRLPATIELTCVAMLLTVFIGIPMGTYVALRRNSAAARGVEVASLVGVSMPTFAIGILLISVFSVWLGWLPGFGRGETRTLFGFWSTGLLTRSGLESIVLPAVTLALFQICLVLRLTRAEMLQVLRADYIRFAHARGLRPRAVHFRHALRNSAAPIITMLGLQFGTMIAFAVVTETVFQWPGVGLLLVQAVGTADVPVLATYLILIATLFVIINLLVDIACATVDPRLRAT